MSYDLFLDPEVHRMRYALPGNMRQRIRRLIDALRDAPRLVQSNPLDMSGLALPPDVELRRIRLDRWRIIYAVNDQDDWVWVLAIRRRPPYDYDDLADLIRRLT
ncbi:MAG: type II toxin-antitoxin system RelE/ParE family toxin [Chloroflexales bacterium]|nr:type II toxin-antitoxin system RelE/ParE family toxin [Chloroflexales bacterium]